MLADEEHMPSGFDWPLVLGLDRMYCQWIGNWKVRHQLAQRLGR